MLTKQDEQLDEISAIVKNIKYEGENFEGEVGF